MLYDSETAIWSLTKTTKHRQAQRNSNQSLESSPANRQAQRNSDLAYHKDYATPSTVVVHETVCGTLPGEVMHGEEDPRPRKQRRLNAGEPHRVVARFPAQTLWKPRAPQKKPSANASRKKPASPPNRSATSQKKPAASQKKPAAKSLQWMSGGVEVGNANQGKLSHRDGNKKVTMSVLPHKESALQGKPRGTMTLTRCFETFVR